MANREELVIIRGARAGDAAAQLALGKLYLRGGASLPRNPPTALHWLCRAAAQGLDEAWQVIGRDIPIEVAQHSREDVVPWYGRAAAAGDGQALRALALLLLGTLPAAWPEWRAVAVAGLEADGSAEAQWLLARSRPALAPLPVAAPASHGPAGTPSVEHSRYAMLEQLWQDDGAAAYLQQALPLARALLAGASGTQTLPPPQALLLARCAQVLTEQESDCEEAQRMRDVAARSGDRMAQLALGLHLARMNTDGDRVPQGGGPVNFKRALRWLTQAGEQGLAEAWFAMSRIYIRPEFSQRSVSEAQSCLERAAGLGHSGAQLECGIHAWRQRRGAEQNDVTAAYWLQKAAAQGSAEAQAALARIAPPTASGSWAEALLPLLPRELVERQPLLVARLELAVLFRLTRAEALLLDVKAADQGHCLVVDIRASYGRGKRRLVLVGTAQERQALDRIVRLFEPLDCSLAGPEGNYRQRLYRFKTSLQGAPDFLAA